MIDSDTYLKDRKGHKVNNIDELKEGSYARGLGLEGYTFFNIPSPKFTQKGVDGTLMFKADTYQKVSADDPNEEGKFTRGEMIMIDSFFSIEHLGMYRIDKNTELDKLFNEKFNESLETITEEAVA